MARARRVVDFDVWGCRGSRNLVSATSDIGNNTSCYSVLAGIDLFVFDAGRGLTMLGRAVSTNERFAAVRRIHLLVTHAHMDHWEGLKDVEWFWIRENGLEVTLYGTAEALATIDRGFGHPSYVPLERLSYGTVAALHRKTLRAGEPHEIGECRLDSAALHHYSGDRDDPQFLDTLGFRLTVDKGPVFAYLSDHEPTPDTGGVETQLAGGADLAVFDSHFVMVKDQAYGHGSQEHTSEVARKNPDTIVLAGHLNPNLPDENIEKAHDGFARRATNFGLAREGRGFRWNATRKRLMPRGKK